MIVTSAVVIGSVNLDIVAGVARLPSPGETVTGAHLRRFPGGKGANQALAAQRLGARVSLIACIGEDAAGDEALALLQAGGVDLASCRRVPDVPTGTALIAVAPNGENTIVVAPGANALVTAAGLEDRNFDALICQLEVPTDTIAEAAGRFAGFLCVNLAPAREIDVTILQRADLVVVNETEAEWYGNTLQACRGIVATTRGSGPASLVRAGELLAEATPPGVATVDTTGAGDTFTAALTLGLVEGRSPGAALDFACRAAALATTRMGAQPALPTRKEVEAFGG